MRHLPRRFPASTPPTERSPSRSNRSDCAATSPGMFRIHDENLVRWIIDPSAVVPGTLMPSMGVTPADARAIAAYLRNCVSDRDSCVLQPATSSAETALEVARCAEHRCGRDLRRRDGFVGARVATPSSHGAQTRGSGSRAAALRFRSSCCRRCSLIRLLAACSCSSPMPETWSSKCRAFNGGGKSAIAIPQRGSEVPRQTKCVCPSGGRSRLG